jgi:Mrp family chromosome partitioning ATPase
MSERTEPGLLKAMARYWRMSLVIVLGLSALSAAVAWGSGAQVQVRATIGLSAPRQNNVLYNGVQGDASLARYTTQRARFVTSDAVIGAVAADLGRDDLTALRKDIIATASVNSNVVTVLVNAADAESAVALAQSVVDSYRNQTALQVDELTDAAIASLNESADEIRNSVAAGEPSEAVNATAADAIGQLQIQAADLETSRALTGDSVEFVIAPRIDSVTMPGPPLRELALGFVVGLAIAASIAWVRADRNRQLPDAETAAEMLGAPCLGEIPRRPRLMPLRPETISRLPTHDHRLLWTALSHDVPRGAVVLESVGTDAPAWTAINLAAAAAREGHNVLVVDADLRAAPCSQILGQERSETGLAGLLTTGGNVSDHIITISGLGQSQFALLPAGPVVDEDDVFTSRVTAYLPEWTHRYDYVLIAAESIREGVLATKLAQVATGMLVVVGHDAEEHELVELRRHASVQDVAIIGLAYTYAKRARQSAHEQSAPPPPPAVVQPLSVPTTSQQRRR